MLKFKQHLTLCVVIALFFSPTFVNAENPVYLDASFGPEQNGTIIASIDNNPAAYAVSLETNQGIIAAGHAGTNQIVVRYKTDGNLDTTFGTNGFAITAFGESSAIYSATVQADGKIVTAGISVINGVSTLTLSRYTSTGELDGTFGSSGSTFVPIGDGSGAYSIALQNTGNMLLVAGAAVINGVGNLLLAQFNSEGTINPSFGSSGVVTTILGTSCTARAVKVQQDGNIIVAGTANTITGPVLFVSRYTAAGAVDTSFGSNGVTTTAIPGTIATIGAALVLQSDGKLLIAGSTRSYTGDTDSGIVVRYSSSGALDTTFGNGGITTITSDSSKNVVLNAIQIDADNSIIITGFEGNDSLVIKLTSSGQFDNTFGSSGIVVIKLANGSTSSDIAIQSDSKYLIAGYTNPTEVSNSSAFIARVFNNNTPFVLIKTPANGSSLTSSTTIIAGTSSYAQAIIQLALNSVSLTALTTSDTGSWSYGTSPLLINGPNTLTVNLYSGATLLATDTSSFTVATADSIAIEQPQDGSTVASNTITISGTSTQSAQTVKVYIDGVLFNTVATTPSGAWYAGTTPSLTNNAHTIAAELYQGTTLLATSTINIAISGKDTILITAPVKGSTITTNTTPITGTSSGNTLDVNIFIDGAYFTTLTTTSTGAWNAGTTPALSNGNHIAVAQLTNALGEVIAIATSKFTVTV